MSMTHTLNSNATSVKIASAIMTKNERRAEAEVALKNVDRRGCDSALGLVVAIFLGILVSMRSGDGDCAANAQMAMA